MANLVLRASLLMPALVHGQAARTLTATVVKVVDGDTIHIVRLGNRIEKVRYIVVNAPEPGPTPAPSQSGREEKGEM